MLYGHLYDFFGEKCIYSLADFFIGLFVFLILSCSTGLYLLKRNSLWVSLFARGFLFVCFSFFPNSEGCLLLMISFAVQRLLMFIRFHLFISVLFS